MKKTFLIFSFFLCATLSAQNYTFSVNSGTYQSLNNSISLNNGEEWDDPSYAVPIGFPFQIGNYSFSTLYFGASGGALNTSQNLQGVGMIIAPFAHDLESRSNFMGESTSPISYQLVGQPGNQILKIEWKNAGFWGDPTGNDFVNFQVWLHEATSEVSFHYGPSSISPSSYEGYSGPRVIFAALVDFDTGTTLGSFFQLFGDPLNPTINNPADEWDALHQMIPDGTIYTFIPDNLSIGTAEEKSFVMYPNPASDYLNIQWDEASSEKYEVVIFNGLGEKVRSFDKTGTSSLNISDLPTGVFFVTLKTNGKSITKKMVKF